jgi:dienelactone hydrolase
MFALLAGMLLLLAAKQIPYLKEFDYNHETPAEVRKKVVERRAGVTIFDYSYASPTDGRVPAYLVVPKGKGPFAVVLYGHWMMPGSPLRNRKEFLEEAILMARSGAICLLPDTPLVRPGVTPDLDPMHGQAAHAQLQMAVEFRRGLDLLLARPDVDPSRVAYVGHSFDAAVGAKLAAVEKRIGSFVLMAGGFSDEEYLFDPDNAEMVEVRKREGDERIHELFRRFPWDDPVHYIPHSAPAAVFLQYGRFDQPIPERVARRDFAKFGEPKHIGFYDAGHELNAAARRDRVHWLVRRLSLRPADAAALNAIPNLK